MKNILTDPKLVDEVLERGVEKIFPSKKSFREKLTSGERIRLYCGFDPSAPALHIGNAAMLNKMAQFQKLGHEVIFLVGDFTGMIGDPTDKEATRKRMTREEVLKNAESYQKQASGYLKFEGVNPAKIRHNSEWSDKLTFKDLIDISSNFTVQQMMRRDMFERRMLVTIAKCRNCGIKFRAPIQFGSKEAFETATLKNNVTNCPDCGKNTGLDNRDLELMDQQAPIFLHEFLYPLAQGYDSVAMDVDLEIGGNDQMFNMLVGRDLQKIINKKEKFVMTLKLLEDESGKKMGKSEGNAVFLDQSPEDMYGAVMSWTDEIILIGFEMATAVPMDEILKMKDSFENPRDFKMKLAYEIVRINYGEEAAGKAQDKFVNVYQKREELDDAIPSLAVGEVVLIDWMVGEGLANSKSDARRKIEQGGVTIGGKKVKEPTYVLSERDDGEIIRVGKLLQNSRKFVFKI